MFDSKSTIKIVDNVFVKMFYFSEIGDSTQGHAHVFDHITLLASGAVMMKHDNGVENFIAPHLIVTPKGVAHEFIATQPNTVVCCVHAIRDGLGVDDVAPQSITEQEAIALTDKFPLI